MVKDYAEQILQSVKIVVDNCMQNIPSTKIENCLIVNDKDKKNGHYTVNNGSTKYEAYTDKGTYKVDDYVRVSIPNGDYSGEKYIEGLAVKDQNINPITFVSPMETMLDMTDNIIPTWERTIGLRANDPTQDQICLWSADFTQAEYRKFQNNSLYDNIAIKGDFKTLLTGYNVNKGSYGLKLDMYFQPTNETNSLNKSTIYLDSSNMYGNPYSFLIYSTQALKFNIEKIQNIQIMSLYFYQSNDFTYLDDNGIEHELDILNKLDPDYSNLLLKNVYLSFGSDIANVEDNVVKLYTNESLEYDRLTDEESINTKGIGILWYNKDDNGKYLGFSDGIYDKEYDEIEYLKLTEYDSRLLAQQGKDVPLDAAGLDLSADIVEAEVVLKKLKNSITQDLYQMLRSFRSRLEGVCNDNKTIADCFEVLLNSSTGSITTTGKTLEEDTDKIVDYYLAKLSNARAKFDKKEYTPTELTYTKPEDMIQNSQNVFGNIQDLLDTCHGIISKDYAGFMSIYDSFKTKLLKLVGYSDDYVLRFTEIMKDNHDKLEAFFKDDYEYTVYKTVIDEKLYSNRYCIYWYRYNETYENPEERFMERGWERLIKLKDLDRTSNSDEEIRNWGLPEAQVEIDGTIRYDKRPALGEDTITRVMDINTAEEKYCVIIFYNHAMYKSEPLVFKNINPPQDEQASDQNGALYIEHGKDSRDVYQSYGVNNFLVNAADAYRTRYLRARYEGLLGGDELLLDGQIFWYVPLNATMLTYDLEDYGKDFTYDLNDKVDSPNKITGHVCFYRKITDTETSLDFPYHIKDYYVAASTNNDIICKVITKDNRTLEANMPMAFTSYGTSGTDYTLTITPSGFATAFTEGQFEFDVALFDYNNEKIEFTSDIEVERILGSNSPYQVSWDEDRQKVIVIPNTNKNPGNGYYYGAFKVSTEFTIPEMKNETGEVVQSERVVNLTSICVIPYTSPTTLYQGQVYIEGPSFVVYDSSGSNPTYYKNPFKIYSNNVYKDKDVEIADVSWSIKYYTEKGEELNNADKKKYELLLNWMPKLSKDNKLIPSSMYLARNKNESDLFPVVICMLGNQILYAQPIYIMQNRYASAMLNEWDGSLVIDKDNGTILSTMVGAGRKTTNNTFEGVLMGDVGAVPGSDCATGIGLYGYHDGAQSFRFGVDGTAFIGKSGRGRLLFDGNNSTIKSASYLNNGKGMMIDFDDGVIDIVGTGNSRIVIDQASPYFTIQSSTGNKLIHIGDDGYYLQTNDYNQGVSGLNINLSQGSLKAYNSFSLEAGSENGGGVMFNASPESGQNYLFAGKTSSGFIKVNGSGEMSLFATAFKLQVIGTNPIYLSNETTNWTVNNINRSNIVLGLGNSFGVDNKGSLYAKGATLDDIDANGVISSANIYATTLDIGNYKKGTPGSGALSVSQNGTLTIGSSTVFQVTPKGELTCTSATIGGWKVSSSSSGFYSSDEKIKMNTTDGINYNNNFTVSAAGSLQAKDAIFDTSLTVNSARSNGKQVFYVNSSGDLLVHGKIYSKELNSKNYIYLGQTTHDKPGILMYGDDIGLYSDEIWIGNGTSNITTIQGTLKYKTAIQCYDSEKGAYKPGVSGTFKVKTGILSGAYLEFINGILVDKGGVNEEGVVISNSVPNSSSSDAGKVLSVKSNGDLEWSYIKKKFDLKLSGTISNSNHNYYIEDSTKTYTEQGTRVGLDLATNGQYYEFLGDAVSAQSVKNYTGTAIIGHDTLYTHGGGDYLYDSSYSTSYYNAGTSKSYKTYKKAGNINIEAIRDGYEMTLSGGDTTDNVIDINISNATINIK